MEAIIPTSPLRLTAGVCVLATGLLFGAGGAIASADDSGSAGTSGSTGASQGTTTGTDGSETSGATTGTAANTTPKIDRRFRLRIPDFSRLSPSRQNGFNRPTTIVRGGVDTTAKTGSKSEDTELTADESEAGPADDAKTTPAGSQGTELGVETQTTEDGTAPGTQELATDTDPAAEESVPTVPADGSGNQSGSNSAADDAASPTPQTGATPAVEVDAPATPEAKADPLTNAFVTINGAMVTWSESLAALQTSKTPVRDAIASLQTMLTTVAGAVTRVPSDFYAMLGIPASAGPPQSLIGGSGTLDARKVNAPTGGTLVGPHPGEATHPVAPADSGSLFGTMAPRPVQNSVPTSGAVQPLSVSGTVPLSTAAAPASAKSIFEHVIEAVLVPASLTALAAMALPGVGALLIVAAAGIRVGYRQAKAAVALRASGIARFAGPGPLGVVRSGSMVALRQRARGPRTKRAVCPEADRMARSHEHVA
ncbi:hypothetical protein AU197_23420 [Mycobacterium sp. IS-1590]|uniref:hypothetical protein n=1 Tax=Mycobacterium sp. IS-1590 TaxID=1772286 RepID=UPI000749D080|nr:hypothetical protein [Mycobacterium sp. IS-1590]KUI43832.1 hypothetical protein AU197_23420 [Mycobacterium sp. IS-1590]